MGDISKLEDDLTKALSEYRENVNAYCDAIGERCTSDDLLEIAKYGFYALYDFKKAIIKYLKNSG